MTERQLLQDFMKQCKSFFGYKIPDAYGGRKKPFDAFFVYKKRGIAIEFKKENGKLEDHQLENLLKILQAGGVSLIGTFVKTEKTERHILFHSIASRKFPYLCYYHKGKYLNIDGVFKHFHNCS